MSDRQEITATFGIMFTNSFLPMKFIYNAKTSLGFPKFNFPDSFGFRLNSNDFSNMVKSLNLAEDIMIPYLDTEWKVLGAFSEQMTEYAK